METTFEVRVRVKSEPFEYYSRFGKRISHEVVKMFHFDRNKPEQAIEAGQRYGEVISCCKVKSEEIIGNIENMKLDQPTLYDKPRNAMLLDEQIWRKRNNRRANLGKDKMDS
jgi:hypothetical protein